MSVLVLIADDNDVTRAMLRGILRQAGLEVVGEARDTPTAVEMAQRLKPRLICLDVTMPGGGGLEALRQIRARDSDVAVLMVTGDAERDTVQQAITAGINGYVVKPFTAAQVMAAVAKALTARGG